MIRVLIADDHPVVRKGIRNILDENEDIEVVGEAVDGDQALLQAQELRPDVLILDFQMPGLRAPDVVCRLHLDPSPPHVLVLTAYSNVEFMLGMMRAGAEGYLLKEEDPIVIVDGVRTVTRGQVWLSSSISQLFAEHCQESSQRQSFEETLTERELEVLEYLAQGFSNSDLAEKLVISEGTVRNHVSSIYRKLGANSRAEAVAWAWQRGLTKPGSHL